MQALILSAKKQYVFEIFEVGFGFNETILIQVEVEVSDFLLVAKGIDDFGDDDKVIEDVELNWEIKTISSHFDDKLAIVFDRFAEQLV